MSRPSSLHRYAGLIWFSLVKPSLAQSTAKGMTFHESTSMQISSSLCDEVLVWLFV